MTPYEQTAIAIAEHGRPQWILEIPKEIYMQVQPADLAELLRRAMPSPDSVTRTAKYETIIGWCAAHIFDEVTVKQLIEVSGLSAPTVRRFIADRVDLFQPITSRSWEVRDPKSDRRLDRR